MEIYVGGYSQEKLKTVLEIKGYSEKEVIEGEDLTLDIDISESLCGYKVINHFHEFIRKFADRPDDLYLFAENLIKEIKDIIIICDQVGGGVVPVDKDERQWRELVGRIMCRLVEDAGHVERIVCGLRQVLK